MENKNSVVRNQDEVYKLRDMVRKLEIQNEELRSKYSRNGIVSNNAPASTTVEHLSRSGDSFVDNIEILEINSDDFLDEERWLYVPSNSNCNRSNVQTNLLKWLRQDVDNNNDQQFQKMRRMLIHQLEELEQGLRRNSNIDTRTFTRPKKGMSRPSLETMVESPLYERRKHGFSPWSLSQFSLQSENIEDINITLYSSITSTSESFLNANFPTSPDERIDMNATFNKKMTQDVHYQHNKFPSELETTYDTHQKLTDTDMNATFLKAADANNATNRQRSLDLNTTFQVNSKSRSITPSGLNCTFSIQDGGSSGGSNRSLRTMSSDSVGDDDQLSSASDSSFSSGTRLMNVGDVQNIARMQEESLKQVMSTPKNHKREGLISSLSEDLPSPIPRSCNDLGQGYHSDHSDHSSAEGRTRSSRSSVKSSPGGSPFGSTNVLSNAFGFLHLKRSSVVNELPYVPETDNYKAGSTRRELKLAPPGKQDVRKPQTSGKASEALLSQEMDRQVQSRGISVNQTFAKPLEPPPPREVERQVQNQRASVNQTFVKPLEPPPPREADRQTQHRGASGLRQPAVRSRGASTAIARPAAQTRSSNIPRPASRIPAPRIRPSAIPGPQPGCKTNWMDGCY